MSTPVVEIEPTTPVNLRDLGGIPIAGGVLRAGVAIRADDLSVITAEDARDLVERGLVSVIDLRSREEVAFTGRGPLAGHPVTYHHLPLMGSLAGAMSPDRPFTTDQVAFGELYARMVHDAAPQLASALAIIALAPGTTAFHCAAGRDRTGVLAAALLLALGASDDDIVADYARTDANLAAIHARIRPVVGVLFQRMGVDLDTMSNGSTGEQPPDLAMRTMIARLRETHGDPLASLRAAGLADAIVTLLRERALAA